MADECTVVKKNLGIVRCNSLPQLPKGMFTTPPSFKIPAATIASGAAAIQAYLLAAMKATIDARIYFWPDFVGYEDISDAAVYDENILADLFVFNGKNKFNAMFQQALCVHKAMFSHNGTNQRVIIIDINNQLNGTENSSGDFQGFTVSLLNVEKLKRGDGTTASKSVVRVVLKDSNELDQNGALLDADFLSELASQRLTDVELTVSGTPTTSEIKFTVKTVCDNESVSGFDKADFSLIKASDGTSVAVASLTQDPATGVYTATSAAAFVDGVFNLKAPSVITLSSYESTGGLTINV